MASPTSKPRVAITGAGGMIGRILQEHLADRYEVVGLDRRRRRRGGSWRRVDLSSAEKAAKAIRGAELVIDLAADPSPTLPWKRAYRNNISTTFNVLEAARLAGARRVVYASSNHVTGVYEREQPFEAIVEGRYDELDPDAIPRITTADPIRPDGPYGLSKAFGEAAGRWFADEYGLSVLCLRIGTVNGVDRPRNVRQFATLLTHRDLAALVTACLEAPDTLLFGVYYGVSGNTWRFWDIENARRELGYEPQDDTERWR